MNTPLMSTCTAKTLENLLDAVLSISSRLGLVLGLSTSDWNDSIPDWNSLHHSLEWNQTQLTVYHRASSILHISSPSLYCSCVPAPADSSAPRGC